MLLETLLARLSVSLCSPHLNLNGNIGVLYFHRILPQKDPFFPDDFTCLEFDKLIKVLSKSFNLCSLSEAFGLKGNKKNSRPTLCITFDDGYLDNYESASTILESYDVRGSFFVSTEGIENGYLGQDLIMEWFIEAPLVAISDIESTAVRDDICCVKQEREWRAHKYHSYINRFKYLKAKQQDEEFNRLLLLYRIAGEPKRIMMTKDELVTLHCIGHDIGGHTHSHKILATLEPEVAKKEILTCFELLTKWIGVKPMFFAYPNGMKGDYSPDNTFWVRKAGFKYAFTAQDGGFDPLLLSAFRGELPRFMPYRRNVNLFALSSLKIMGES